MKYSDEAKQHVQAVIHGTRNKLVVIKSALGRYRQTQDERALDRAENTIEQLFGFLSQLAAEIRTPDSIDGDEAIDTTPSES